MNIQIDSITRIDPDTYRYVLRYGDKTMEGEAVSDTINDDGFEFRSLKIPTPSSHDLLAFAGAHSDFAKDFWAFVDGNNRPLPWNYGDIPEDKLKKALDHYNL